METPYENLVTPYTLLNGDRCALLVIDTQNDYGDPKGAYPMPDLAEVYADRVGPDWSLADQEATVTDAAPNTVELLRAYPPSN